MFGGSSKPPTMLSELCSTIWFDNRSLGSSRKQGGAAEHLNDGSEKRICRLSFEFWSSHVIEKRSNACSQKSRSQKFTIITIIMRSSNKH